MCTEVMGHPLQHTSSPHPISSSSGREFPSSPICPHHPISNLVGKGYEIILLQGPQAIFFRIQVGVLAPWFLPNWCVAISNEQSKTHIDTKAQIQEQCKHTHVHTSAMLHTLHACKIGHTKNTILHNLSIDPLTR